MYGEGVDAAEDQLFEEGSYNHITELEAPTYPRLIKTLPSLSVVISLDEQVNGALAADDQESAIGSYIHTTAEEVLPELLETP